jgi:hypothetical protein
MKRNFIKGLLGNFLSGAGEAMMHHAGIETPYERQQRERQLDIEQQRTNAEAGYWGARGDELKQFGQERQTQAQDSLMKTRISALEKGYKIDANGNLVEMSDDERKHMALINPSTRPEDLAVRAALGDETAKTALNLLHPTKPTEPHSYDEILLASKTEQDPQLRSIYGQVAQHIEAQHAKDRTAANQAATMHQFETDSNTFAALMLSKYKGQLTTCIERNLRSTAKAHR